MKNPLADVPKQYWLYGAIGVAGLLVLNSLSKDAQEVGSGINQAGQGVQAAGNGVSAVAPWVVITLIVLALPVGA